MENVNFWINVVISILAGIATCIPLVIKLVQTIKDATQAKNWSPVMQIVLKLMQEAEANYSTGAEKKEYVIDSLIAVKDTLNYEIDIDAISVMIDSIVDVTKKVNTK